MKANPWRGEVELTLDNKPYVLRPTFEGLSQIEQKLGTGFVALARKLSDGLLTLEELNTIIFYTMKASGELLSEENLQEMLLRNGLGHGIEAVGVLIAGVFEGFHE